MPRRVQRLLIFLFVLGLLGGCGQMRPMGPDLIHYTVKPGDTLYSVSWRYGYDHREVAAWNNIPAPYTIYVGQQIQIISPYQRTARAAPSRNAPVRASPSTAAPPPATPRKRTVVARTPVRVTPPVPVTRSSQKKAEKKVEKAAPRLQNGKIVWRWPTGGNIRNRFAPSGGKKGLDIEGKMGQPIFAAAGGKVVYSGDGLIGYGNLIIIKHDNTYLSAYGHNRRLLVKEGSEVKQGQKIAEMGDSGKQGVILHFEIRRDGKPVDPLRYLPKKDS